MTNPFQEAGIYFLSQGSLETGERYWAYILVPLDKVEPYQMASRTGDMDLQEFGTILQWGVGEEPPAETKAEMEKIYALQHNFSEKLVEELRKTPHGREFVDVTMKYAAEQKRKREAENR